MNRVMINIAHSILLACYSPPTILLLNLSIGLGEYPLSEVMNSIRYTKEETPLKLVSFHLIVTPISFKTPYFWIRIILALSTEFINDLHGPQYNHRKVIDAIIAPIYVQMLEITIRST